MGALSNLAPLAILFIVVAAMGFIGYHVYVFSNSVADASRAKMEKKHIALSREGLKVEVRPREAEEYSGKTQNLLVQAWNYASFPAYKSKLWNTVYTEPGKGDGSSAAKRPQSARQGSGGRGERHAHHSGASTPTAASGASYKASPAGSTRSKTLHRTSSAPGAWTD